jgi:SagB-type dehydrogenase family enzyme
VNGTVPTTEFASIVFGAEGVALDDAAEAFHEASRLYPNVAPSRLSTLVMLSQSPELQQTVARASRTHEHRSGIDLPRRRLPKTRFRDVLDARTSEPPRARRPLPLDELAVLLAAAYGSPVDGKRAPTRRPVPSGGALCPLELYALPLAVPGLGQAAFHYDPFRHRLTPLRAALDEDVAACLVDPTIAERSAVVIVVTAMFWRTRFKYGVRGYRFALLEAGHVVQNVVLAATALRLAAVPLGGWYDRRVDALVGANGLDEAAVYLVAVGGRS